MKMTRKMWLADIIACFGSQAILAKFLGIETYVIQGWLHNNARIFLDYAMPMLHFYHHNGYVLKVLYKNKPTDTDIQCNVLYLYVVNDALEYAAKDNMQKIKRIKIIPGDLGKGFKEIKTIVEDDITKKELNAFSIALISKLVAKRGYNIKKGYAFSIKDLTERRNKVTPEQFIYLGEQYKQKTFVSQSHIGLKHQISTVNDRRGRKKKNREESCNEMVGKTVALYFKEWGFKSVSEYFRVGRVLEHGLPELIHAMDTRKITICRAEEIAKRSVDEQKAFLNTLFQ